MKLYDFLNIARINVKGGIKTRKFSALPIFTISIICIFTMLFAFSALAQTKSDQIQIIPEIQTATKAKKTPSYEPNVILVKFQSEGKYGLETRADYILSQGLKFKNFVKDKSDSLDKIFKKYPVKINKVRNLFYDGELENISKIRQELKESSDKIKARFPQRAKRAPEKGIPDLSNWTEIKFDEDSNIKEIIRELKDDPHVITAQPNYEMVSEGIPDDTYFSRQWGLNNTGQILPEFGEGGTPDADIDAPDAWDIAQGDGIVVAVVDTGVDYTHLDLDDNMLPGWDFGNNDADPMEYPGGYHGTHVSGIIAAEGNNNAGVIGVAPDAMIMPVKVFTDAGSSNTSLVKSGIMYAVDHGADVINNSMGCAGPCPSNPSVEDAVDYARAHGVIVAFAAMNENADVKDYSPQNMKEPLVVANSDFNDQRYSSSSYGVTVDVAAPGRRIVSTTPDNGYLYLTGTSMASPHVAGLAALLLSNNPDLTLDEIDQIIRASADDIESPGFDMLSGYGRINAYDALGISSPCLAIITDPAVRAVLLGDATDITISGTSDGPLFQEYQLFHRPEESQDPWIPTGMPVTDPVVNGVLGNLDVSALAAGSNLIKLEVTSDDGYVFKDIIEVTLPSAVVTLLDENSQPISGKSITALDPLDDHWLGNAMSDADGKAAFYFTNDIEVVYFSVIFYSADTNSVFHSHNVIMPSDITINRPNPTSLTVTNITGDVIRCWSYNLSDERQGYGSKHTPSSVEVFDYHLKEGEQYYFEVCEGNDCVPGGGILSEIFTAPTDITVDLIAPVDGVWCEWSECSAQCDGGTQTRECACPAPANGGIDCSGPSSQSCNEQSCGPVCGDGYCAGRLEGEDCLTCSDDCIGVQNRTCSACWKGSCDGTCNPKKETSECADCAENYCCGDGICESAENAYNCQVDCGCLSDSDCDDGESCTADTCNAGICENTWPACGVSDGCCADVCTPSNDPDCVEIDCSDCFKERCDGSCHPTKDGPMCPDCQ